MPETSIAASTPPPRPPTPVLAAVDIRELLHDVANVQFALVLSTEGIDGLTAYALAQDLSGAIARVRQIAADRRVSL